MKRSINKFIILFFLIFAVLEKSGVSVTTFILADAAPAVELILFDPESNTKEAENTKEASVKEVWLSEGRKNSLSPSCNSLFRQAALIRKFEIITFYPSIPTPPPNLS